MDERSDCLSSSEVDRNVQCAASHNMGILAREMGQNRDEPSDDAQFGINVHDALQQGSAKGLKTDEERMAFSVMRRLEGKFVTAWRSASFPTGPQTQELREHRMWLHKGAVPVFTGKADLVLLEGNRALIIDHKSLWSKVPDPIHNHQLKSLACLLWLEHKELKEITIQIIAAHYDYQCYVMGVAELRTYLSQLEDIIRHVNQANAPVAGDWCRHCRGMLVCPAVKKKASDLVKMSEDDQLASRLPRGAAGAKFLDDLTAISTLIDKARDHYKTMLSDDPGAIPGWTLSTQTRRKFKDVPYVFKMLEDKLSNEVFDVLDISVSKAFAKLNSVEQQTLAEYVEKTQTSPSLRKKGNGHSQEQNPA